MHPLREPLRVPRRPRGQRLGPEVVVESGEVQPGRIAARELRNTGEEHEPEDESPDEPSHDGRGSTLALEAGTKLDGRVQHGQEPGLEQQAVPLEPEERLADHAERQVRDPEQQEDRGLGDPCYKQQRERRAGPAQYLQHAVARSHPAERRKQPVGPVPVGGMRPLEEFARRQDAPTSHEARDLQRKRDKGDEIHDAEQAEEQPAREDVALGAGTGGQTLGDVSRCALAGKTVIMMVETRPCPEPNCAQPSGVALVQHSGGPRQTSL